ncbi:RelA/SpoT domain-containing protein [Pedobacter aquatilis]|uniref:RelA/SpoT domain-containing protein n=1 Tax=Pedobacter aquatilis TaxID=351343 RepID=UPI00292DF9A0|nr:RelA/SpoT domain-containing protein [Pedobacter aquatilis]
MAKQLGARQLKLIDELVAHFIKNRGAFVIIIDSLNSIIENSEGLKDLIHSQKSRIKDPDHLRDKLIRKAKDAIEKKEDFDYTVANLFAKINDLAGFRILHLHTTQFAQIDTELKKIFDEQKWQIIEGPNARTWDDETRSYFDSIGVETSANKNMYTSVHYILKPNNSTPITCEIQVRTLMEEVWGEVDHKINYPHKSESHSCREQIKTLARVTSSCSRLVDSIFSTYNHELKTVEPVKLKKTTASKKTVSKEQDQKVKDVN